MSMTYFVLGLSFMITVTAGAIVGKSLAKRKEEAGFGRSVNLDIPDMIILTMVILLSAILFTAGFTTILASYDVIYSADSSVESQEYCEEAYGDEHSGDSCASEGHFGTFTFGIIVNTLTTWWAFRFGKPLHQYSKLYEREI